MLSVARRSSLAGVAIAAVAAVAALIPSPAHALDVIAFSSAACTNVSSTSSLSNLCFAPISPPANVSLTADSSPAHSVLMVGNASANAFQSPFGYDRARADAGVTLDLAAAAAAEFALAIKNDQSVPVPMRFRFFISNAEMALTLRNYVAVPDDEPIVEIRSLVRTRRDFGPVETHWAYRALLAGTNSQFPIGLQDSLNFVDPQGIGKPGIESISQALGSTAVDFEPFFGDLDLGVLAPDETMRLFYQIDARVYTGVHDPNTGSFPDPPSVIGYALIEDPFSLDSGFYLNGRSLASLIGATEEPGLGVPAPSAWLLVGIAAAAFAARRQKRR